MVYRGPSSGCKTCRLRHVKCDRTQPSCSNCTRRRGTCPGYGDVFDGAHRSQNQVVQRQIERHSAYDSRETSSLNRTTSSDESTLELVSPISHDSVAPTSHKRSPRQTAYSRVRAHSSPRKRSKESPSSAMIVDGDFSVSVPYALKPNVQDNSTCFFFRYYAGTAFDPEARNGFNKIWQPMYSQALYQSSLRLATEAVTVNITMMWCSQGCNSQLARQFFTSAIAAARAALYDPLQSSTDELLMTILIFDLYEALVLHYTPDFVDHGKHKYGALAIIEHRGSANLATRRGRALVGAVRHSLLPYLLSSRKPFPGRSDHIFDHPSLNETRVSHLDQIAVQLSRAQSRLWTLRLERRFSRKHAERRACYEEIVAEALRVEELLLGWEASIIEPDWLPEYVPRHSVTKSIQDAGFYGDRCSVWVDLEFGSLWIVFFIHYLFTLQIVRQSFADESSLLDDPDGRILLSKVNQKVQDLVDSICEAIPFHLGDNSSPENPMYSTKINFPYKLKAEARTGKSRRVPSLEFYHQKRAGASGGWMLFPQLVNVWRFAEPEDDAIPIVLREGQLAWIEGQVKRLQKIFLFCEPVWFKRLTPGCKTATYDANALTKVPVRTSSHTFPPRSEFDSRPGLNVWGSSI